MTQRTILIVEDEPLVTFFLQEVVHELGFRTVVFAHGKAAVATLERTEYAAAIVDLGLPDISGHDVALAILDGHPDIPVILATGHDTSETRAQFSRFERACILGKPFDAPDLRQCLLTLGVFQEGA